MLRRFIRALTEPALVFNQLEEILQANIEAEKLFGYSEAELIGQTAEVLLPSSLGSVTNGMCCVGMRNDGTEIPLTISLSRYEESGQQVSIALLHRHVTEEAHQASEDRYQNLFENAHDIVFTTDLKGAFTSINPAAEQILGYTREELLKVNAYSLFTGRDEETAREMLQTKISGKQTWTSYTATLRAKDGHAVTLELNTRIRFQAGVAVELAGIARDVSERLRLETELHQAQKMESVGRLAGGVAHDFNNLLTIILGHSQLLLCDCADPAQTRAHAEGIEKAALRAANVTRQLLAFSRKTVVRPVLLDLGPIISNITPMLERLIGEDVTLVLDLAPKLGLVRADSTQIEQAVMNLVVNSRDAMPHGGTIRITAANISVDSGNQREHPTLPPGNYTVLSVADTGEGMDEETKRHLFEPFFTTKDVGKGTGLGLATVYGMTKQDRGFIELSSERGRGTEFRIYLPHVTPSPLENKKPESLGELHRGTGSVLLVEDEDGVRALVGQFLHKNGYEVIEARNGLAAMQILKQGTQAVDVLLTDVIMPGITGPELVRQARVINPELKAIYMSGYTRDIIDERGIQFCDVALMTKPFTERDLMEHIQN